MNRIQWKRKIAKIKRNFRNAIRGKMRKAVNFALADEPSYEEHAHEVEIIDNFHDEAEIKRLPQNDILKDRTKLKKVIKVAGIIFATVVVYRKLFKARWIAKGVELGMQERQKYWNEFFDKLIARGMGIINDSESGMRVKLTPEVL